MKAVAVVPTYNEKDNIERLINGICSLGMDIDILVVDDDSPDGTSGIVKKIAAGNPKVHLMLRKEKKGRGYAGIDGFKAAVKMKPDYIIEMDADLSHNPSYIPALIDACTDADIAVGSRCVQDGGETGRGVTRRLITKLANTFVRYVLGFKIMDTTSGYRCFRREVLEAVNLDTMVSSGPSVVGEVNFRAKRRGFTFKEVPIIFEQRGKGKSNLNFRTLFNTFVMMIRFRFFDK